MIAVPSGVRVWIAAGYTDMRCGMNSLALRIEQTLRRDPHAGDLYVFRGKSGKLIKVYCYDGLGASQPSGWRKAASSGRRPRTAWW